MAVPDCNRFSVLAYVENSGTYSGDYQVKRRAKAKSSAIKTSTADGEALSSALPNGHISKSRRNDHMTNSSVAAVKVSSFKAAQMASLEKFNKMVAAKYPDMNPDVDIPDKFSCAVCWQIMVRPTHCIPCKHSFCEPCLRSVSSAANGRFRCLCPYCRQSIHYTSPNQDLETEMKSCDHVTAVEYEKRLKWFEKQENMAKMPLPGFAPLRWVSRICPWRGPCASKFIDFAERQLFDQFASFALQHDEDHFSHTSPILTTIFDLLLVLFFYFAISPDVFLSVNVLKGLSAGVVTQPPDNPKQNSAAGNCVFKTIGAGLLYLLPSPGLDEFCVSLCGAAYATLVLYGCFRFIVPQWSAMMHELGAGSIWYWYLNLPFAASFLWARLFTCECFAKLVLSIAETVPNADSKAGFVCILLGLTFLLHLPSMITKPNVNSVIWTIGLCSILFAYLFCGLS